MEQRHLGRTGLRVSRLGLGTLTWGRDTGERDAADQLKAFWDAGGTLVDTADVYADGGAEYLLGRLIEDLVPRADLVIATKAGSVPDPDRRFDASRGHLLSALDASLQRLGTDYVDLWQVHAFDPGTPLEETLQALDIAVSFGPRPLRRGVQLLRLAARQGRDLAARPGPGAPRWPVRRWSTRCSSAAWSARCCPPRSTSASGCCPPRRWAAACSPASTGTAPRRTRAAAPSTWPPFVAPYLDETARAHRGRGGHSGRRARPSPRCRWRWPGYATARASPPRSSARATRSSSRPALSVEALTLPEEICQALDDVSAPVHRYPDHDWSTL